LGGVPKQLLAWLSKLLPQQKVVGDSAIQIGKMQGHAQVHVDKSTHLHKHTQHLTGGVHVGYAGGDVNITQTTESYRHSTVMVGSTTATGPVVVNHHHYHMRTDMPMHRAWGQDSQFPTDEGADALPAIHRPSKTVATPRQRQVLALIKRTGNEKAVLSWMSKTFGTRWVVALDEGQLRRVELYCETVISNTQTKRSVEMGQ
jgi:hypothetical protein